MSFSHQTRLPLVEQQGDVYAAHELAGGLPAKYERRALEARNGGGVCQVPYRVPWGLEARHTRSQVGVGEHILLAQEVRM